MIPLASSFLMRSITAETDMLTLLPITEAFSLEFAFRHSIIFASTASIFTHPLIYAFSFKYY